MAKEPKKRWFNPVYMGYFLVAAGLTDAINTLIVVGEEIHEENPIMAYLLDIHPAMFLLVKMSLTIFGAWFLVRHSKKSVAYYGLVVCSSIYALLMSYQLFFYLDIYLS